MNDLSVNVLEPPVIAEYDGPETWDDLITVDPDHAPWTVLLMDPDSLYAGLELVDATALIHLHAADPAAAVALAIQAVQNHAKSAAWHRPVPLFVTEGYHQDLRPNTRREIV